MVRVLAVLAVIFAACVPPPAPPRTSEPAGEEPKPEPAKSELDDEDRVTQEAHDEAEQLEAKSKAKAAAKKKAPPGCQYADGILVCPPAPATSGLSSCGEAKGDKPPLGCTP